MNSTNAEYWRRRAILMAVLAVAAYSTALTKKALAEAIPADFRVYDNYANVKKLVDYNDVVSDPLYTSQPWGLVKFSDGNNVPVGYKLCFLDQGEKYSGWDPCTPFYPDRQPIGIVIIEQDGGYNFNSANGSDRYMYGDNPATDYKDDGAQVGTKGLEKGEDITIIAQAPDNRFYEAHFTSGNLLEWGYLPGPDGSERNDIEVYDANELSNLSYDMNDLDRFTWWWLADDCNDVEYWSGIDPNLCYCEEFDADWDGDMDFVDFAYFGEHWED